MKILWRNFPIPEPFVFPLLAGGFLQIIVPASVLPPSRAWIPLGSILMITGVIFAFWAVFVAGNHDLTRPASLLTKGPYAFSRNPMYLAWTAFAVGLGLLLNSLWLAIAALGASIYIHTVTIPGEEQALQRSFGAEYASYRKRV